MNGIGPGLGYLGDDTSGASAIFSGEVAGEDPEFLDGVGIGIVDHAVVEKVVVQAAVQHERVGIAPAATDAEL